MEELKSGHVALRSSASSLDLQQASLQERLEYMEVFDYGKLVREMKEQEARNVIGLYTTISSSVLY